MERFAWPLSMIVEKFPPLGLVSRFDLFYGIEYCGLRKRRTDCEKI